MKEKLSAFVDNELDELETRRLLTALAADEALRASWGRYHLIGATLRRESITPVEVAARVAARLGESATARPLARVAARLALAASVAVIALVGAQRWLGSQSSPTTTVAQNAAQPVEYLRASGTRWSAKQPEVESTLNAFLVEHNEFAPTSGVGGMFPYVRVVGYDAREGGRVTPGAIIGTAASDSKR
ncbi:MAG: sigma-E factor negative regulatory protein [Gammaproteobacteria bacterium]|nr:sigma-E factor negative regulatory protein [Gammaproteobacteria bacterium]